MLRLHPAEEKSPAAAAASRRAVRLAPALTLVTQALLREVFGALGLFVAGPLTVCAVVFVNMLYVEGTLGDKTGEGETRRERPAATELGHQAG
jgi:hypothetical protein